MMEVKTRKQAILDGDNTYFTGMPCKNGHLSYRYVQSGTCYGCIHADHISPDSKVAKAREARLIASAETLRAKNIVKDSLVQIKLQVHDADLDLVKSTVHAFAVMRYPALTLVDVCPNLAPTVRASDRGIYSFNCHEGDIAELRKLEKSLSATRPTQFEQERQARLADQLRKAHIEPVPSWADKP